MRKSGDTRAGEWDQTDHLPVSHFVCDGFNESPKRWIVVRARARRLSRAK